MDGVPPDDPAVGAGHQPSKRPADDAEVAGGSAAKVRRTGSDHAKAGRSGTVSLEDPTQKPKFKPVADLIKISTKPELITVAFMVDMFRKLGFELRLQLSHHRGKRKHIRPWYECAVMCEGDRLAKAKGFRKKEAARRALGVIWDRLAGYPRFHAVAELVKTNTVSGSNCLEKLNRAFNKNRFDLETKFKKLPGEPMPPRMTKSNPSHQCLVWCDGELLAVGSGRTKVEAKRLAYEALWAKMENYPDPLQQE